MRSARAVSVCTRQSIRTASTLTQATPLRQRLVQPLRKQQFSVELSARSTRMPMPARASMPSHRGFASATTAIEPGSSAALQRAFAIAKEEGRPAFLAFLTAGYPTRAKTVDCIVAMAEGGADIIELGVPFTDPLADGPTIQASNQIALEEGTTSLTHVLEIAREARLRGVTTPFVLMGYYNPLLQYEHTHDLMVDCRAAGISGFIVVDLPPEEAYLFRDQAKAHGLSFIPLIAPTTTDARLLQLAEIADSFIYAVSLTGVTGVSTSLSTALPAFMARTRAVTDIPIALGFGIGNNANFKEAGTLADGVVVGSAIINTVTAGKEKSVDDMSADIRGLCQSLVAGATHCVGTTMTPKLAKSAGMRAGSSEEAMFGQFGGRYVSETLVPALEELEREYAKAKADPSFEAEVRSYDAYIGRPSSLHLAERLTEHCGGARIWLKREDLNHTGAHKINNAIAQAILAKRLGKKRIVAETGAGQHGVATATICAKLGLELVVYMGADDVKRQALNVFRMEMLGAKCVAVDSGSRTLKDAINEALRDWVTNINTTHYLIGSAIGPHPFPTIVRDFQRIIGVEARDQMLNKAGKLPDHIVACVGGGSNAIGIFHPFLDDDVALLGVEAGGEGVASLRHSATLARGSPGVLHGTRTYLLQDPATGQLKDTHSISAGLDYPGVGPEHAFLKDLERASYVAVSDHDALMGFKRLTQLEGIIPALETAHAIFAAMELARTLTKDKDVLVCVSGRGDKDVDSVRKALPEFGCKLRMREQADL